jgi:predicted O-methyltransferase YrrM
MNKIKKAWNILKHEGISSFLKKLKEFYIILKRPFDGTLSRIFFYPYASWKLNRDKSKIYTVDEAVTSIFNDFGRIFAPTQVKSEIIGLCEIVEKAKPKTVVEIGTYAGGTLFLFARLSDKNANIVSIDLPQIYTYTFPVKITDSLYKKFGFPSQKITLLKKDSHKKETLESLRNTINNREIDFLFIDGDHNYEGVKQDYEMYSPLVRKGGIIAFHDICKHFSKSEVDRFWNEIKIGKNYKELIEDYNQGWCGIGVIFT